MVVSHPIQYYAPWFAHLQENLGWKLRVFYLWDFGITPKQDVDFKRELTWDLDLLNGYEHEWVPNRSRHPGTHRFDGLYNPSLFHQLRSWSPDVILVFGYGWRSMLHLALRWRDCPLILRGDSHDLARKGPVSLRQRCANLARSKLMTRYRAFAAVGQANRAGYRALGVPDDSIHFVPHCVDNERFAVAAKNDQSAQRVSWRSELGLDQSTAIVLFAGKFETKKRPDLLLEAYHQIDAPDSALVMVGDGALRPRLEQLAQRDSRVHLLPFLNQSQMPVALAAADLTVLPSEGPGETWGLILNESLAAGTPILASSHVGAVPDLVDEGVTGWSFEAGNLNDLGIKLSTALSHIRVDRPRWRQNTQNHIQRYSYAEATRALGAMLAVVREA